MSISLSASLSCSLMPLDFVGISTRDKFSSLPRFSPAIICGFLNCMNWLLSHCEILDEANVFVIVILEHSSLESKGFESSMDLKVVQLCFYNLQNPYNRYRVNCPTKQ